MPRKSSADVAFPATQEARLTPPDDLAEEPRALFIDIVASVKPGYFEPAHRVLLAEYCEAVCQAKDAGEKLKRDGYLTDDGKPSVLVTVQSNARRASLSLARSLRLTPSSQYVSSPPAERAPPISYYERQALEHRNGDREPH
ncbi:phage terminase small subunit [Bradyrhizobium huanghuaihaiense]